MASFTAVMTIWGSIPFSLLNISIDSKIDPKRILPRLHRVIVKQACRRLPLELQIGLIHLIQGNLVELSFRRFQLDPVVFKPSQLSNPARLIFDRLSKDDFRFLTEETLKIGGLSQLTLHTRGTHLQGVRISGYYIFGVQHGAKLVRHKLTIRVGNTLRLIDVET